MHHSFVTIFCQVGLKLYQIARTDLVKLQDALQKSGVLAGQRPKGDEGWKVLFPDGLDSKTGVTEANVAKCFKATKATRAKYNPMKRQGMTDVDIYQAVKGLSPTYEQTRSKMALDRRHADSGVRALVVTSAPCNLQSANRLRDWTATLAWAVAEFAFVKEYREKLFTGPAGAIRLLLSQIFDLYAIPSSQANIAPGGGLVQDKKFAWCDMMVVKDADTVLEHTRDIDSTAAASNISQQDAIKAMKSDIQRLINMWENSPSAYNSEGPPGSVDAKVASILSDLVEVCPSFTLSFSIYHILFQAAETNAARNRYRSYHAGDDPAPPFDPRNAQHFDEDYVWAKTYRDKGTASGKVFPFSSVLTVLTIPQGKGRKNVASTSTPNALTKHLIRRPINSDSDDSSSSSEDPDDVDVDNNIPPQGLCFVYSTHHNIPVPRCLRQFIFTYLSQCPYHLFLHPHHRVSRTMMILTAPSRKVCSSFQTQPIYSFFLRPEIPVDSADRPFTPPATRRNKRDNVHLSRECSPFASSLSFFFLFLLPAHAVAVTKRGKNTVARSGARGSRGLGRGGSRILPMANKWTALPCMDLAAVLSICSHPSHLDLYRFVLHSLSPCLLVHLPVSISH